MVIMMKLSRRQVLRASSAAALAAFLSGCAQSASASSSLVGWLKGLFTDDSASSGQASASVPPASSEAAASSPASTSPASEAPSASETLPPYNADPLTGEERTGDGRMVGIMVNNICSSAKQNARPHRGISAAPLLIECKVEGSISRLCAVYNDAAAIPEVGPIRSGRDQFLQLLMPWQAVYYHDGESIFCTQYVKQWGYWDLNLGGKSYFDTPTHPFIAHRDSRDGVVAYEHTEFTSGKEIVKAADNAGIDLTYFYESTFFPFTDYRTGEVNVLRGCANASKIIVYNSTNYRSAFRYNSSDHNYKMQMYSARTKAFEDTIDENNGEQLTFANIIVCFAPIAAYPGDSADVQEVEYSAGGAAYFFTRGKVLPCQWAKPSPDSPLEITYRGEEVRFNRGHTYLAIVDEDEKGNFEY